MGGQGRVIFVTGEAGSGKTTLVAEFARRSQTVYGGPTIDQRQLRMPTLVSATLTCRFARSWSC